MAQADTTRLADLLKRDVVTVNEGRNLGKVEDIVIDPHSHRVAAIVLGRCGPDDLDVVAEASDVTFGGDVIAVRALEAVHLAYTQPKTLELMRSGVRLGGRQVYGGDGHDYGEIDEVRVDAEGIVREYRLKGGLIRGGKRITPEDLREVSGNENFVLKDGHEPR